MPSCTNCNDTGSVRAGNFAGPCPLCPAGNPGMERLMGKPRPNIQEMRTLLKLVCLGDAKAAADLDNKLQQLS